MIPLSIIFSICCIFIWSQLIIGISFMEAWLKFNAPDVSVALGLGIGRIVFRALTSVEWVLITLILVCFTINNPILPAYCLPFFILTVMILSAQTFLILPKLEYKEDHPVNSKIIFTSSLHFFYIFLEFVKLIVILTIAFWQIKIIS